MTTPLRLLIIEDSRADFLLLRRALTRDGFEVECQQVDSREKMREALAGEKWDLALSDYHMPGFSAEAALALWRETVGDSPFIVVSGALRDEDAVTLLKEGANDFVRKDHSVRLGPAVRRALRESEERLRRRQAEEALRSSEAKFRCVAQSTPDALIAIDADGFIRFWNRGAQTIFGFEETEVLDHPFGALLPEAVRDETLAAMREAVDASQDGAAANLLEMSGQRKNGDCFSAEMALGGWRSRDGGRFLSAVIRDISERKATEAALMASRESLAEVQRVANMGRWRGDPESGFWEGSEQLRQILGVEPGAVSDFSAFLDRIHPKDRERVEEAIHQAWSGDGRLKVEHRIIRPHGGMRIVLQSAEPRLNPINGATPENALAGLAATVHDLTDQRLAEDRLRIAARVFGDAMAAVENQLNITAKVFENAIEGMVVTDENEQILSVNPAFTAITGYTSEEAVGRKPDILRSERHGPDLYREMRNSLTESGFWEGEIWNRRKNGEAFPKRLAITAITNDQGHITNYVRIFNDLTDIKRSQEELWRRANHDALTGLPNRILFTDRLRQATQNAQRTGKMVAMVKFDLDYFKNINESLGYPCGDWLLQEVAGRMKRRLRDDDTLSRLAGDEFGLVLRELNEPQDALPVVQKLVEAITSECFLFNGHELFITASIGISIFPSDGEDPASLIPNADMALHRAKSAGRAQYQFYARSMGKQASRRLELEGRLRKSLELGEFILHYQPKLNLASGGVDGMECLVRWIPPDLGMVPPGEFIPLSEETGLIVPLGDWILKTACTTTRAWHATGFPDLRAAVNLSARQFRQPDLIPRVREILEETGLDPQHLELEVTESMVMGNVEEAIAAMKDLTAMGIRISVDDFGTGYSSLSYLKQFPIHALKIDRSFVRDLTIDSGDAAIVSAIISMSRSLNLQVVAEGVETPEQFRFLRDNDCDLIQGYLFGRPLPETDFIRFLKEIPHPWSPTPDRHAPE